MKHALSIAAAALVLLASAPTPALAAAAGPQLVVGHPLCIAVVKGHGHHRHTVPYCEPNIPRRYLPHGED